MYLKKIIAAILSAVLIISALPVMSFAVGTSGNEIAFAVDTGAAMDWYTFGAEDAIADALTGIVEQAPNGCTFSVVTNSQVSARTNKETAIEQLYNITAYTGMCDMEVLVENAANLFSSNANKTLFIVTNQWAQIEEKVLLLEAQGVTVYVVALESDKEMAEEIQELYQNAIVCQNAKEMSYRLADVYEEMTNLVVPPAATVQLMATTEQPATTTYNSSFRMGKHGFNMAITNHSAGAALAALLNMYYLMPARVAKVENITNGYKVTDAEAIVKIGNGITYELIGASSDFNLLEFWNDKAVSLFTLPSYYVTESEGIINQIATVEDNLRRRFPVMIAMEENGGTSYYLIINLQKTENDTQFQLYDPKGKQIVSKCSGDFSNNVRVLDTKKYFNSIYATHSVQADINTTKNGVILSVPTAYPGKILKYTKQEDYYTASCLTASNGTISINITGDEEFSVAMDVDWSTLIPNIHNATTNYRILLFSDVDKSYWASSYIFNMTNQKVINGYGDGTFKPEDEITIGQYLAMVVRAADIEPPENSDWETDFPTRYVDYAKSKELIDDSVTGNEKILRELAFYITWNLFTSEDCRTPTQLREYEINSPEEELPFSDLGTTGKYNMAIAQLYMNKIVNGVTLNTLVPEGHLTRAQSATVLSRCIEFDSVQAVELSIRDLTNDLNVISLNKVKSGKTNEEGSVAYLLNVDTTGLYRISFPENNFSLHVYQEYTGSDGKAKYIPWYAKAGKGPYDFPIQEGKNMVVVLYGNPNADYTLKIEQVLETTQESSRRTAYIVFYDSPIKRYLDGDENVVNPSEQPIEPSVNDWNSYERYDVSGNQEFFKNYLNVFGDDVDPVFVLSVRDADFNTKRRDDADRVTMDNNAARYENRLDGTTETAKVRHARNDDLYTIPIQSNENELLFTEEDNLTNGSILTFAQYKKLIVDSVTEEMVSIIEGFNEASQSTGMDMPKFYVGIPTFRLLNELNAETFSEKYFELAVGTTEDPGIYYNVLQRLQKKGISSDCIEGIYNGCEETPLSWSMEDNPSAQQKLLLKISKFVHQQNKKFLWIPYKDVDKVGAYVNTGIYQDEDTELSYDIFDVIFMQPSMYFNDDFKVSIAENGNTHTIVIPEKNNSNYIIALRKLYDLYHSAKRGVVVFGSTGLSDGDAGAEVNGGKFTDTQFGVEIEYDMSLLTGRWNDGATRSFSKQKALNFLIVLDALKSIIYEDGAIFATYSGGMNEQAYDLVGTGIENNNRHSLINYQTALGERPEGVTGIRDTDIGNGKPYSWFFDYISEWANTMTNEEEKEKRTYNSTCPKDLLYEITLGIMQNQWAGELNRFLAIPDAMLGSNATNGVANINDSFYPMIYQNNQGEPTFYYTYPQIPPIQ